MSKCIPVGQGSTLQREHGDSMFSLIVNISCIMGAILALALKEQLPCIFLMLLAIWMKLPFNGNE